MTLINSSDILRNTLTIQKFKRTKAEGYPIIIENAIESKLKNYSIYGSTSGVGNKTKNLFNINSVPDTEKITNNRNGTLTINNNASNSVKTLSQLCPELKAGDTVTLSATSEGRNIIYLIGSKYIWSFGTTITITQKDLDNNIYFYAKTTSQNVEPVTISNIQIEKQLTPTNYEPYGYKIPINVKGENCEFTYNIYIDNPLYENQYINLIENSLPNIEIFKGKNIIKLLTQNPPSEITLLFSENIK